MKKILFIINSLGGGGAEKALIEFLRHIDYTRYEVSLCLVFHEGCYLSDVPPEVRVFWLYERERNFVHRKSLKLYRNHGIRTLLRLRPAGKYGGVTTRSSRFWKAMPCCFTTWCATVPNETWPGCIAICGSSIGRVRRFAATATRSWPTAAWIRSSFVRTSRRRVSSGCTVSMFPRR